MIINNQKEQTNLKTSVTYKGNGTQKQFDFPFDYLRKAFVKVSVNDAIVDGYTIDNRSVIFNIAPASNDVIVIYRETTTERLVSWADASVLKATDMTISQVQQLHILEEGKDWSIANSMVLNGDNEWEGRNHKIVNVVDPTTPQGVVTKHYMETVQGGFVQQNEQIKNEATKQAQLATQKAKEADTSAKAAKASEGVASTKATEATEQAQLAKWWAQGHMPENNPSNQSAKEWAKASEIRANIATEKAELATQKATESLASANKTKESAAAAKSSETAAKSSEAKAKASETKAKASETAAKASETAAKSSETNAKASETAASNSANTATTKASEASASANQAMASADRADTAAQQTTQAVTDAERAAELATSKALEAFNSANTATTKASEASTSAAAAKVSETKAKASETNAGTAANKATTEANRAKTEADRAKNAADSVGNPVVSITQSGGNLTVTKGDGSSNTLTVTPAKASQAEAEAGTDDIKMMTPLKTKEAILANIATDAEATAGTDNTKMMTPLRVKDVIKTLNLKKYANISESNTFTENQVFNQGLYVGLDGHISVGDYRNERLSFYAGFDSVHFGAPTGQITNQYTSATLPSLSNVKSDCIVLKTLDDNLLTFDAQKIFGTEFRDARVAIIVIWGPGTPVINWLNCELYCEPPTKEPNKTMIVTFLLEGMVRHLVSASYGRMES